MKNYFNKQCWNNQLSIQKESIHNPYVSQKSIIEIKELNVKSITIKLLVDREEYLYDL